MRTLQEKYNAIQEGKFSKEQFLVEARMQQPQFVTRFNGYDDAVQILKNRGMIQEARVDETTIKMVPGRVYASKNGKLTYIGVIPPGGSHKGQKNPTQENLYLFADESGKKGFGFTIEQLKQARMDPMSTAGDFGNLPDGNIVTLDGTQSLLDMIANATVKRTVSGPELNEARLTKNNLADYRYKPTNEMDKYPYEQILRGLRVELEVMGVQGTPSADEYAKALAKVSKNLAKDSIFYTNQLAGNNKKVDLHDKMVAVTAKNTVDTFNGMKKLKDLKEDHSKNPDDKYVVRPCKNKKEPWAVWEGETRVKGFATKEQAKEYADKQNKKQGLTESVLKEGIKNLIKKALMENEQDVYELYGDDSVEESAMGDIYQIAQEHDRFEHFVQAVEDEFGPVDDIAELEHIFNSTRGEDDIDYGDENFSDPMIDGDLGENKYAEADTETDRKFIIKLMGMYEQDPSKYENLEKEAEMLASTESDPKYQHVFGLIKKAKQKALESLANQDRFEADREGMDESISLKDLL